MRLRIPKSKNRKSRELGSPGGTPSLEPMATQLDPSVLELAQLVAELPDELRELALTHGTWVENARHSYRRLAFIGDSVLGLFVAEELNSRFPNSHPGRVAQIRDRAICGTSCAEVGHKLGVPKMLEALRESGQEGAVPTEVLLGAPRPVAEMTEALIGASYLTFGFKRTRAAVIAAFEPQIQAGTEAPLDPKSMLHKLCARRNADVDYEVISKSGSEHAPLFKVVALVDSERLGEGEGRSKKIAEHAAAERALEQLG